MMKPMNIKWGLFSAICLLAAVTMGCGKEPEAPAKPKVVVKKISVAPKAPKPAAKPAKAKPEAVAKTAEAKPETAAKPAVVPPMKKAPVPARAAKTPAAAVQAPPVESAAGASKTVSSDQTAADPAKPGKDVPGAVAGGEKPSGVTTLAAMATKRIYTPEGRINPFKPLFQKEEKKDEEKKPRGRKREHRIPQTPLEKVDLGQLKLVAVMQMQSGPRALVEESSGKGYVVRKGTYMGIHSGQVVDITGDRVIVEEEVENLLGDFEIKKRELKLQKPLGE